MTLVSSMKPFRALLRAALPARWHPRPYLTALARARTGSVVRAGPFAGMRYGAESFLSAYIPKLLGIYERELSDVIEQACRQGFPVIVDVGAAEGYYAVGMALRNPGATVVAFEIEPAGRAALQRLVRLNGVEDRLRILGRCGPAELAAALAESGPALVICDVEGAELELLDPARAPGLLHASILVETHDAFVPGITETLKQRFGTSHRIREIDETGRSAAEFPFVTPYTRALPRAYLRWAVSEWRPVRNAWLWMQPYPRSAGGRTPAGAHEPA